MSRRSQRLAKATPGSCDDLQKERIRSRTSYSGSISHDRSLNRSNRQKHIITHSSTSSRHTVSKKSVSNKSFKGSYHDDESSMLSARLDESSVPEQTEICHLWGLDEDEPEGKAASGLFWWLGTGWYQLSTLVSLLNVFVLTRFIPRACSILLCLISLLLLLGLWLWGCDTLLVMFSVFRGIGTHTSQTTEGSVPSLKPASDIPISDIDKKEAGRFDVRMQELEKKLGLLIDHQNHHVEDYNKLRLLVLNIQEQIGQMHHPDHMSAIITSILNERFANVKIGVQEKSTEAHINKALWMYSPDGTGMADFALESGGGSILGTRCSETYKTRTALLSLFGIPLWYVSQSPRVVIQPDMYPGNCWAFKGTQGYLVVRLSMLIYPTAFSLEHIPKSLSPTGNITSAPKDFAVYGLEKEYQEDGVLLVQSMYDIEGEPLQIFRVMEENKKPFQIVELQIFSNWGHTDYTCLYRFRAHGTPVN